MRISYHGAFNGRPVNGSILMLQDDASVAEAVYAALGGREPKHTRMVVATEAGGVMSSDADTMAVAFKRDIAAPDDAAEEIHDIIRAAETPLRAVLSRHIAL